LERIDTVDQDKRDQRLLRNTAKLVCLLTLLTIAGCASVPLDQPKTTSAALVDTDSTYLAKISAIWRATDPEIDSFYPLIYGMDAFGARLALMDKAERSIDAQYFMMKPDLAGMVFASKLYAAAERGVRVRLLVDDIFTTVDDSAFILLDQHPNIELRIFNPISRKGLFAFNYVGHFRLANRRMHNKSFTVDNQISIVGGRNIAEEYFQLDPSGKFIDFDMLMIGSIVPDISASFDHYWNHELAIPMTAVSGQYDSSELEDIRDDVIAGMRESGDSVYAQATHTDLMQQIYDYAIDPFAADAEVIVDDPGKLLASVSQEQKIVATRIAAAIAAAQEEIIVFTPYFIPGPIGIDLIREVCERGVRVILVTNSLATNNHIAVHSAYSSYRKQILMAGVELWEARRDASMGAGKDGSKESENLTLHTKGVIIDRRYTFVGSLNLDPRSIDINTEMGVMIDSKELSEHLADVALKRIPDFAYRLRLDDRNRISWHANINGQEVVETKEPLASVWRRFQAWVLKIAPEKQL
jgi:cardiolipin synthase C